MRLAITRIDIKWVLEASYDSRSQTAALTCSKTFTYLLLINL
jgi:hypothetical protein